MDVHRFVMKRQLSARERARRDRFRMLEEAREARLIYYFSEQDEFFPYADWPIWVRHDILLRRKGNRQRFTLFRFFVLNGLRPQTARRWIQAHDAGTDLVWRTDEIERTDVHFDQMTKQFFDGTLGTSTSKVWDMVEGRKRQYGEIAADARAARLTADATAAARAHDEAFQAFVNDPGNRWMFDDSDESDEETW